jgi:hypothetical protein
MNEPKRRGRPPKVAAIEQAGCPDCGQVVGHADDCPVGLGVPAVDEFARRQAQAYANRIWAGQSVSLPRAERLRRVKSALEGQGMSMEGVNL